MTNGVTSIRMSITSPVCCWLNFQPHPITSPSLTSPGAPAEMLFGLRDLEQKSSSSSSSSSSAAHLIKVCRRTSQPAEICLALDKLKNTCLNGCREIFPRPKEEWSKNSNVYRINFLNNLYLLSFVLTSLIRTSWTKGEWGKVGKQSSPRSLLHIK